MGVSSARRGVIRLWLSVVTTHVHTEHMEVVKMRRSKKSELLIGVMIGVYGNWLIAIVEKLGEANLFPMMLFAFSFVPFVLYFHEIFTEIERQTWVKMVPLKNILGVTYLILVFVSLWISGIYTSETLLSWTGIALWTVLMLVERRALA